MSECVKQFYLSNWDVFMAGMLVGGLLVVLARALEKRLELWHRENSLRLDVTLGRELLQIKEKLDVNRSRPRE